MLCAEFLGVMVCPLNMAVVFPASYAAFFTSSRGVIGKDPAQQGLLGFCCPSQGHTDPDPGVPGEQLS